MAALWCLATLVFILVWCAATGRTFTGVYAGLFGGDQFRYLAWIRQAGLHGLIADPYRAGAPHVYLQPVFLLSGLLWRAGLSVQLAYLLWTPVALGALLWGFWRFVREFLSSERERAAALALALLFFSPLTPLFDYGRIVNANGANYLVVAAGHTAPYWQAWGFLPTVLALGLMPVCLLAALDARRRPAPAAVAGLLVAWLHPWGGIELVMMLLALLALRPALRRRLVVVGVATALPLAYYAVLAGLDSAWSLSLLREGVSGPVWPLVFTLGPLLALASLGIRSRGTALLWLWLLAALLAFLALPGSRDAALEGLSLPMAILAVGGWRRFSAPPWVACAALLLAIGPGAFYSAHTFRDLFRSHDFAFGLRPGEQAAVDAIGGLRGNVLATGYLAGVLPAVSGISGDRVVAGANGLFAGQLPAQLRSLVSADRIEAIVSDCLGGRRDLEPQLANPGFVRERFGCAAVYRRGG